MNDSPLGSVFTGTPMRAAADSARIADISTDSACRRCHDTNAPLRISAAVACLACAVFYQPPPPVALLTRSPLEKAATADRGLRMIHFATGRSATVSVLERRGSLVVRSNGLQEAEIFPRGSESLA